MTGETKYNGSSIISEEPLISASAGYDYEVKLKISRSARNRLPENFNIQEIGSIDLNEAEAIANEDILFLTENDLIEGLEDFDLIPLNEGVKHAPLNDTEINTDQAIKKVNAGKDIPASQLQNTEIKNTQALEEEIIKPVIVSSVQNQVSDHIEIKSEVNINNETIINDEIKSKEEIPDTSDFIDDEMVSDNSESSENEILIKDSFSANIKIINRNDEVELIDDIDIPPEASSRHSLSETDQVDLYPEVKHPLEKEKLPEWAYTLESTSVKTYFIDDETVENDKRPPVINFEEKELEKITSRIIETYDVKPKILLEADVEDDKENIAYTSSSIPQVFDDLLVDFEDDELKYRDDDLEFIHSAIIEEDFSKYLRLIDEYYGLSGERKVTAAVELLGLTNDEIDEISDVLYSNDYKGINLDEVFSIIKKQSAVNYKDSGRNITCKYFQSEIESLKEDEKKSIEADISSEYALIFEEDVEQLKSHLKKIFVKVKPESVKVVEEVYDITDRVVILEDEDDMKRFVKEIPENKRDDLVRLMKYLDGMFEKLPENSVKNFAESEYFNLYVKILNDLGI